MECLVLVIFLTPFVRFSLYRLADHIVFVSSALVLDTSIPAARDG